ncbi:MAG: hypothetical protein ABI411_19010 [Tahibacter sp.]
MISTRFYALPLLLSFALDATALAVDPAREAQVRERGVEVMPFALASTEHQFQKTESGGLQRVVARAAEPQQIAMIRQHLQQIADSFARRDFSAPAQIHGDTMPGLAELKAAGRDELAVDYRDVTGGAEIEYRGSTPTIRDAIHRWFDAQLSDHGHDAVNHTHHGS